MILRALDGKIITNGFWEDILMDLKDTIRSIKDFPEEGMFYLVIRAENASEGITVTATLVDENWDPVQE